ncbi:MAG: MFS transporter [Peptococcales bacterium]|jgi:MFS family permease
MQIQGHNEEPQKLWTTQYILIILYSIMIGIGNFMMMTGIPLYAIHIGGDNSIAGLMMGIFMIAAILVRPFFGNLADIKSRRLVLLIGAGVCTLSFFSYIFAFSVGLLLFLRAVNGIGFSANTNAAGTVVADIIPAPRLAEGIGYYGISNVLSTAIGPVLTLSIINQLGFKALFLVTTGFGLISLICSYFINYEKKKPKEEKQDKDIQPNINVSKKQKVLDSIFEKTAIPPSFVMLFVAFAMGGVQSFIPIYAVARNVENIGIYFTIYALALLVTRVFGGKLADRHGVSTVLIPGYVLLIASFIVLAFATNLTMFIISGILYGLGYGSVQPLLNAIMVQFCPPKRRGAGNSTFFTAMDIGSGGGAVIWGFISKYYNFTWVYLLCVGCIILSWVSYSFLLQKDLRKPKKTEEALATT